MGLFDIFKKKTIRRRILCPYCCGEIDTDYDKLEFVCSRHPDEKIEKLEGGSYLGTNCKACQADFATSHAEPADYVRCNSIYEDLCGKYIPVQLIDPEYTVYRIALVGTTSSGKTCFKSRLKEEIASNMLGYFLYGESIHPLEIAYSLPQSTYRIEDGSPLFETPDFFGFHTKEGRKIILVIYDFSGEDISNVSQNQKVQRIIQNADAVFFLIDPEQNFVGHIDNPNFSVEHPELYGSQQADMINVINALMTRIYYNANNQINVNRAKGINDPVNVPKIAYIFSKLDKKEISDYFKQINSQVARYCADNDKLIWNEDGEAIYTDYNSGKLPDPANIIRQVILKDDPRYNLIFNIPPFAKQSDIRYFVCSALGMGSEIGKNEKGEQILVKKGKAFRVLDPLYWLIYGD